MIMVWPDLPVLVFPPLTNGGKFALPTSCEKRELLVWKSGITTLQKQSTSFVAQVRARWDDGIASRVQNPLRLIPIIMHTPALEAPQRYRELTELACALHARRVLCCTPSSTHTLEAARHISLQEY